MPLGPSMPAEPITIATSGAQVNGAGSPQTPFAGSAVGLSTSTPGSLFGKWNAFSTTSPAKPAGGQTAGSPPAPKIDIPHHHEDDHFDHDSLEFGDISDLKNRGWAAAAAARGQRRAVSMSMSPGQTLTGGFNNQAGVSPPQFTGVLGDKMARGQGVLRRLSFTSGFSRPAVPPPVPGPPNPTPIGSMAPQEGLAAHPPAADVHRAGTVGGGRRRYSESTARRRGVSPMGERILRDQVHF